ncbi:hypothetical protein P4S72_29605 [Vibrio sp. PP-XX7]
MIAHQSFLPLLHEYYQRIHAQARAEKTPLLADGIDTLTGQPVCWTYPDDTQVLMSNFASQQNFMRGWVALSLITDNNTYQEQARQLTDYFFDHYVDKESGLFHWGDTGSSIGIPGILKDQQVKSMCTN